MEINTLVLDTLQRAVSQDSRIFKPAEQKLQEWETQPGFYCLLKDIFCNQNIDVSARLIAVLLCKNGVDKYWRPNAPNALTEEEKTAIKTSIISNFHVAEKQIATHLAVLIAKIARHDWPHNWDQLMPTLMNAVKSDDLVTQQVALLCLHQVVKVLSTKRLPGDRRLFQEFSPAIFPYISQLWDTHSQCFFIRVLENQDEAHKPLEKAYLSLKILDKLTIQGFKAPHTVNDVNNFLKALFERCKAMLSIRPSLKPDHEVYASKYIVKSINILASLLEQHPFSFVDYITPTLEFTVFYTFTPSGEAFIFERFIIQCFNVIKSVILCQEFKPPKIIEETKEPLSLKAHQLKQAFFNSSTLTAICKRLVTHYFLLTPRDLELWDTDPESFATDEGGESWKYSLRASTEALFASVFHEYRDALTPFVVELVRENQSLVAPYDINAILLKDAVYNAVGIAAFDLFDVINFNDWFTTSLRVELEVQDNNYRIIRRRVACLVGIWAGVKMSSDLYPNVYSLMIQLLRSEEDMVVRLTAANTVRAVVDDFEFNLESFMDFLEPMFLSLFNLLKEALECDTKMRVLHILCFIVERVGVAIEPYYNSFVQYLPLLWHETEHHSMLRCAVVATLVHLVKAIGKINESEDVTNFILSVISLSTDVRQDCHVYLLEDGLELWQSVVETTAYPTPGLIQLFSNMPPLLEGNTEHLRLCMSIISAYVLLSPDDIIEVYGQTLINLFADMLTDMRTEGILLIMRVLELFMKVNSSKSSLLLKPLLPDIFGNIHKGEEFPMVMSVYLSILARVLLASQETFIEIMNKVSETVRQSPDEVLNKMLEVWLHKMPLITQMERKKLLGLALCSLLISNFRFVYEKFHGIVLAVTEVLNDITRTDEGGSRIDALLYLPDNDDASSYETEHEHRKKQLALEDPVHKIVLENYFRIQIEGLKRDVGPGEFEKFVATLDPDVLKQAREYVTL
ncbi:unnamed protein product [Nezara viridula]|uniref:Importin N-terminal domain-containing protein n=1 Tax=Nezara viridula TaxID=85310 RepID=A0A9P0HTS4_NEZVI|nr:unnamed protein product [Nezara viridula]